MKPMLPFSKVTEDNQVSVPAEIREKLGVGPGSVLEWEEEGDKVVVRSRKPFTFEDIHRAIFKTPPEPRTIEEMDEGIAEYLTEKHKHGRR